MAYEKIMGFPHPNLQKRRLKRLQKEQCSSLHQSSEGNNQYDFTKKVSKDLESQDPEILPARRNDTYRNSPFAKRETLKDPNSKISTDDISSSSTVNSEFNARKNRYAFYSC